MQPNVFKRTVDVEMFRKLEKYVNQNYNMGMSGNLEKLFRDIQQNREVISKITRMKPSKDQLEQNKSIFITYLNEILTLKSKMVFGRQSYACAICFRWTDTIKGKEWESYNIYFELYNCMYNLAVVFYCLGIYYGNAAGDDKNMNKEAVRNYKNALGLFGVLRQEAYCRILEVELPYDLYPSHLEYLEKLCIIFGQIEIFEIAKITSKTEYFLQAKLLLCISQNCSIAFKLSNNKPTAKGGSEEFRYYLNNRVSYYLACVYQRLRDMTQKKFDNSGTGYGEVIVLQGRYVQQLLECQKTLDKCGKFANAQEINNELKREQETGQKMLDLNNRIYHQATPENFTIELEIKDLMIPELPDDLFIGKNKDKAKRDSENLCSELDLLIPSQTKEMIDRYKQSMQEFLQDNIAKYETEKSILNYIKSLNLPSYLTAKRTGESIDEGSIVLPLKLWEKIYKIQSNGGVNALTGMMDNILQKSNNLLSDLKNTLNSFNNEEKDDNLQRDQYGAKWIRKPSNALNRAYIQAIQNLIKTLNQTKVYDNKQNDDIINNISHFETICASKAKLTNDIPGRIVGQKPETDDEETLHEEILRLYTLADKADGIVSPMFEQLNDDSIIINMFIEVLEKTTTEQAIFNKNKQDFDKKFKELAKLSDKVLAEKKKINELAQKVRNSINEENNKNVSEDAKKYFEQLNSYAELYIDYYKKVKKGENYYLNLQNKIEDVLQKSNQWMIKRNEEKNALIDSITGRRNRAYSNTGGNQFQDNMAFMDPNQNMYTNFNVGNNRSMNQY